MSTSLAQQLQRLKVPQTSLLVDSKKRCSILFNLREAAEKDRETIFDIGYSGFNDLVKLNPSFLQFQSVLFDKDAREFQRSVENEEINQQLKKVLKKFLIHLSPYLLLQSAHKCLEWLIRRFHINDYEKDEFMMLILPYHETTIFVKCVQTMYSITAAHDKWHWLEPIRINGVPLSKQALLNRVASDDFLMGFICDSTVYAVEQLDTRPNTLQVYYAFFCTSMLGALDLAKINESHIRNTYAAVKSGLKSNSIDFCAASLMIIGQLVNKVKLQRDILQSLVDMMLKCVTHAKLQPDIVVLLILIYRNQSDTIGEVSEECLSNILVQNKWLVPVLAKIYIDSTNVLPFYLPLLSACFKYTQLKCDNWKKCRKFCDALLTEIFFKPEHAESVIRCTLDSFILTENVEDIIIEIESGNDDVEMDEDKGIATWYTNTLKALERRYPTTFDAIVKEIVRNDNKSMSELKKRSLKKVLSFLFTIVCADDNVNLFEKLYHYNAQQRAEAIKYLVKNLSKMSFSDDSKSLLKGSIAERLGDDSPLVVKEALKFDNATLLRYMNETELHKKYINILERTSEKPKIWEKVALDAIEHLSELNTHKLPIEILTAILPLLLQPSEISVEFVKKVLNSSLANRVKLIGACRDAAVGCGDDKNHIMSKIMTVFESKNGIPSKSDVIEHIKSINDENLTLGKAFYTMFLLTHAVDDLDLDVSHDILIIIERYQKKFKLGNTNKSSKWTSLVAKGVYPVNINIACMKNIVDTMANNRNVKREMKNFIDFNTAGPNVILLHKLFAHFIAQSCRRQSNVDLYADAINYLLEKVLNKIDHRIEFLSNYFTIDILMADGNPKNAMLMTSKHQICVINYVNSFIQSQNDAVFKFNLESFIRILSALRSPESGVRDAALETMVILKSTNQPKYQALIAKLVRRQSEIRMDENQLPLILYKVFEKKTSTAFNLNMKDFIEFIATADEKEFLVALLLEALTHINDENIVKSIANTALTIITNTHNEMENMAKKTLCLDAFKSTIIRNILSRYTDQTIKIVRKVPDTWQLLLKSAESYDIFLKNKSKDISITCVCVELFNNDLFNGLSSAHQIQLIGALVNSATYAENSTLYTHVSKLFKQIKLDAQICAELLIQMASSQPIEPMEIDDGKTGGALRQRRNSQSTSDCGASSDLLKLSAWKCGTTWLEFLQNKKDIVDPHHLIPPLFAVLQKCLQFEDQSNVEYVKQLTLACIHQLSVNIAPDGVVKNDLISEKNFKIEPVVQCIRGTQNPQTHHHALQLLSHSARMLPDQVLHNMMDIFTFMGSSVVRHDDVYSFQIITNIISSIIPTLTRINENKSQAERNELVMPVLKVFSDIILDVPEHRRLPLYKKLLDTLDAHTYLWMFLSILIESHVIHHQPDVEKTTVRNSSTLTVESPQRIEIALGLAKQFSCETIIVTATKLLEFLQKFPTNMPTNESEKMPAEIMAMFNVNTWTKRQYRHFKYEAVRFVNTLTSSVEFVNKVAILNERETDEMKEYYQNAIITILTYIPMISKATEQSSDTARSIYWKTMLNNSFDILENIISLLSSNVLLVVVFSLLSHKLSSVRRRAIELLINKLQHNPEIFQEENEHDLVALLGPLTKIIKSIIDERKLEESATMAENTSIQQMALMAVKLLSKQLTEKHPKEFSGIVKTLIKIVKNNEEVPHILLAVALLSLCEICANLRVHSIPHLPESMKFFLVILQGYSNPENLTNDMVLLYLLTGLLKVVSTLALYMSPYLVNMIVYLSQIWYNIEIAPTKDAKRNAAIIERMAGIWEKFSSTLELRILIPSIEQSYKQLANDENSLAIGPVMQLLTQTIEQQASGNMSPFMAEITTFFIGALQFRANHSDIKLTALNELENKIIKSFRALTLKLSEESFRPLYYGIYDWAFNKNDKAIDCVTTYFRVSVEVAKSLKSLFVLFANDFIDDVPDLLNKSLSPPQAMVEKTRLLIDSIVETLCQVFLHDSRRFINGARFEALLQPLVDQIENEIVLDSEKSMDLISSCLAQLGQDVNDDIQWKQLNYQILMKTRNNESRIRLFALQCCVALAAKLGEDYMPLLPETVPFISELLEDENPDVEKQCQLSVQELEKILGEPLQKYF